MSLVMSSQVRDQANIAKCLELLESKMLAIKIGETPDYPMLQKIMRESEIRDDVEDLPDKHISIGLADQKFSTSLRT